MATTITDAAVFRGEVNLTNATVTYPAASINNADVAAGAAIARTKLATDTATHELLLTDWGCTDSAMARLTAAAGTPAGAFGITVGTHGTASPKIVGEAASNNSKTDKMRMLYTLRPEYVAASSVTFYIKCKESVGAATVATSIDLEAFKTDKLAGIGSDICATASQDVTTATATFSFTITGTTLTAGDVLDLEVTGVTNDTGGAVGTILEIYDTYVTYPIQG